MPVFTPRLPLIGTNGTVTASTPLLDLSQTWNNAGVAFTGVKSNITDTASLATSILMDLQVGGVSKLSVDKNGSVTNNGSVAASSGFYGQLLRITNNTGDISLGAAQDVRLYRDAANTLALRNGVNAQAFNVYNTYTDASNYESGFVKWSASQLVIGTDKLGTGGGRNIQFQVSGVNIFKLDASTGHTVWNIDNTYDIGASGATRPRSIYAGANVVAGAAIIATADITAGGALNTGSKVVLFSPSDGVLRLTNNATTDFNRLQFGGTTSAFPALKRSGNAIQIRLADDSGYGLCQANAFYFNNNSRITDSADGVVLLTNNAATDFTRLMFGGTTSSFPALKRNGTVLEVKLADDSGFGGISAASINPAVVLVASLPAAATRTGQMRFVSDALTPVFGSAVTGGGAVNVPVYSDGTVWRVG